MNTFMLAWRNLLRNRRRSLMTLTAMVLGLVTVLLFGGYVRDINYAMQTDFVRRSGHLQIQHKDYFHFGSGNPTTYGVAGYERVMALLKSDPVLAPMLLVVTPTLEFGAIAGNFDAGVSRTVYVSGVVIDEQNRMREWNDYDQRILTKPLSLSGTAPDSAVIGTGVARVLQLCAALDVPDCARGGPPADAAGDQTLASDIAALSQMQQAPSGQSSTAKGAARIELLATGARGAPNVAAVSVQRAEFQGIKELDDVYVGLHLPQAQKLVFGASTPQVTAIALQLQHTDQIPAARARLEGLLAGPLAGEPLGIVDYETLNPFYGQTLGMFAAIFGFISVLVGAIVLFTVTNTMSMAVVERTTEIGTLRAIGLRRSGIRRMFVTEGVMLGLIGSVVGIAAALAMAAIVNRMGLDWTPPSRIEPVPLSVRVAGEHAMIVWNAIGLVVVAALSALIPAARASRMNIVDALRHV